MTDPTISLHVGQGVTPIENPLDQAGKALSLRGMMQQQQSGALALQQQQLDLSSDQAGRKLFQNSLASGKDPSDNEILGTYGGTKGTAILKNRVEARKLGADLLDTQNKIAVQQADYAGSIGRMIDATGNDPNAFIQQTTAAIRDKHIDPALAQPYIDHIQGLMQSDPTGASATAAVKQITAAFMAKSDAQQKLANEGKTAQAHADQAQTGKDRLNMEAPGIQLKNDQLQRQEDATTLAAAAKQGPDALQGALQQLSAAGRVEPFMRVNAQSTPADILALGMAPHEQATAAQAAANAAETKRHNQFDEATGRVNSQVAQGRLDLLRKRHEMEFGAGTADFWGKQLQDNPDSIKELPPVMRSVVGQKFTAATGLPLPTPLTGQTLTSETAARNSLDGVAFIRQAMQNPEIRSQIGPIMGRLGNAEQRVGGAVGLSPEAEALAQELRTRMRYFVFQEGKAVLGGRLPQNLMKQLEESSGSVKMEPAMLEGALKGAEGAANSIMDNADKQRFGGKMRSREMRGQGNGAPAKTFPADKVHDYAVAHNIDDATAKKAITDSGYTVQ